MSFPTGRVHVPDGFAIDLSLRRFSPLRSSGKGTRPARAANRGWLSIAVTIVSLLAPGVGFGSPAPREEATQIDGATPPTPLLLPAKEFSRPPEKPHDATAFVFTFDQLDHYYRIPGEFTHRLTGDQYGFEALSFFVTETHPGGGPGLHVHDVEEAHVLLEGSARYVMGDDTFVVHAPYIARVPAGIPHTFINTGVRPFNLVAVFASKHPVTRRIGPNPLIEKPGPLASDARRVPVADAPVRTDLTGPPQ